MIERPTRRCTICNINWHDHEDYKTCPNCDQPTDSVRITNDDPIDTPSQSRHRAREIRAGLAEQAAETERQALIRTAQQRRTIDAAVAALRWDLDTAWLEADLKEDLW